MKEARENARNVCDGDEEKPDDQGHHMRQTSSSQDLGRLTTYFQSASARAHRGRGRCARKENKPNEDRRDVKGKKGQDGMWLQVTRESCRCGFVERSVHNKLFGGGLRPLDLRLESATAAVCSAVPYRRYLLSFLAAPDHTVCSSRNQASRFLTDVSSTAPPAAMTCCAHRVCRRTLPPVCERDDRIALVV